MRSMEQTAQNNRGVSGRFVRQLTEDKKKTVMALCLIAVMAFMWLRVLGGKAPEKAEAALEHAGAVREQENLELKVSFIELPNVKGRNDVLTRDFFTADKKYLGGAKRANLVLGNGSEEIAVRIARKLELEAIMLGENLQAFINDKLVAVGDKLLIRDGADVYECEVVGIKENVVFMKCGQEEITLKLAQGIEVTN